MAITFLSSIAPYLWFIISIYFGFVAFTMLIQGLFGNKEYKNKKGILFYGVLICFTIACWSLCYM